MDIREEVINDLGDGDIVNIQLIPLYEKQQQVKRALKLRQLYLVRGISHPAKLAEINNRRLEYIHNLLPEGIPDFP
jgi:hypothetical protein